MTVESVPLFSLQVAGRPTALLSGRLWISIDDQHHVEQWGVETVLERPTSFPQTPDVPVRAKSGPHIVHGRATIGDVRTLPGGYCSLTLQGEGRLTGVEAFIS